MLKLRPYLVICAAVPALLLGACSSGGGSTNADAPSTTTSTATDEATPTSADVSTTEAASTELPNPCEALTAEEFTTATGLTVTAEVDEYLPTACNYMDANQTELAVLAVNPAEGFAAIIDSNVSYPPPGMTYTTVDIGEKAAVTGPPDSRALLVADGVGYDFTMGFGVDPLTTAQLEAVLQAIAS